jgi:DNA-binding Lrp family transcriptional regulator
LIIRASTDYLVRWSKLATVALGGSVATAVVLAAAHQATFAAPRRITASAIASSLGQSRETVRRRVKDLAARGLLRETPTGVYVPDEALVSVGYRRAADAIVRLTRDAHPRFRAAGITAAAAQAAEPPVARRELIVGATNTFCLRMLESMSRPQGDVIPVLLFCALAVANTRELQPDPAAPFSTFSRPMPESLLRPVTALALAAEVGLPRETARRYLAQLVEAGVCSRVTGGFIAVQATFETPPVQAMRRRIETHARQFMAAVDQAGLFHPDALESETRA